MRSKLWENSYRYKRKKIRVLREETVQKTVRSHPEIEDGQPNGGGKELIPAKAM